MLFFMSFFFTYIHTRQSSRFSLQSNHRDVVLRLHHEFRMLGDIAFSIGVHVVLALLLLGFEIFNLLLQALELLVLRTPTNRMLTGVLV